MATYLIIFAVLVLTLCIFLWKAIHYKIRANHLGVNISWEQVLGQRFRKTMTIDILEAASLATKENLNIDIANLETHKIAGGDPLQVVNEIIESKRKGELLDFYSASALNLAGDKLIKRKLPTPSNPTSSLTDRTDL